MKYAITDAAGLIKKTGHVNTFAEALSQREVPDEDRCYVHDDIGRIDDSRLKVDASKFVLRDDVEAEDDEPVNGVGAQLIELRD